MKKLLMMGSTNGSPEIVLKAKEMGVYVITTDYLPMEKSPAKRVSDEYWMISTGDLDALEQKCRSEKIDGIICGVSEFNQDMALQLTKRLGLPCYCTEKAWSFNRDKANFKRACQAAGVPVAQDYFISDKMTDDELAKVHYPVVVKPVDQCSNHGISFCYNREQLVSAYFYAASISKKTEIIVEKCITGQEFTVFYVIAGGTAAFLSFYADFAQSGTPTNCYCVNISTNRFKEKYLTEVDPQVRQLIKNINCTEGVIWFEIMWDSEIDEFAVLEMGHRLSGDLMWIPLAEVCHFDLPKWMIECALNNGHLVSELPDGQCNDGYACSYMMWTKQNAILHDVRGIEEAAVKAGCYVNLRANIGDNIDQYEEIGTCVFTARDMTELCQKLDIINHTLELLDKDGNNILIQYVDFDDLTSFEQ